jgi:hypothetical protein
MRRASYLSLFTLLVMSISALLNAYPAQGQAGIELENVEASYRFGEQILFHATIKASVAIQSVSIVISDEAQGIRHVEALDLQADGSTEFRFDTKQHVLRPFTTVTWNYQFTLPDGSFIQSQPSSLRYADNRFQWQTLEAGTLRLNWYSGDAVFGQAALEAAQAGLGAISNLLTLNLAQPVEIFIYASEEDLRGTLVLGGEDWVAGHADPALGVVMVVIEPGPEQTITMEQRIPHELMHVMLYRSIGAGYRNIPAWLREGTATLTEVYPNAEYERVLTGAAADNHLIAMKDLCTAFPTDRGQAFLAYAESGSFTKYLHDTYGSSGLLNLVSSYASGVDCEHGTERPFGVSLSSLEGRWRASVLGQNALLSTLRNISSYLVLLCLVLLIPFIGILSTLRRKGNASSASRGA